MKKILLAIPFLSLFFPSYSQSIPDTINNIFCYGEITYNIIYVIVDLASLKKSLKQKNLQAVENETPQTSQDAETLS